MAGITTLSGKVTDAIQWSASNNIAAQQPLVQGDNVGTSYTFGTSNANAVVSGADEVVSFLQVIAPGGSATINLQSVTNIMQQSGVRLARLKAYKIRLLIATGTQGAVDTVNGTPCSSITVGNAGANPNNLELSANGTVTINSGGSHQHFDPTAAGFALVSNAAKNVLITNNDGANAAAVQVTLVGATS